MWWVIHMCRGFDPLFSLWQDRARSFWGIFLIHQQQSYLLGYKNYQFLQKSIFLAPNSIFSSIFLGPIFSGQRHTPISFQAEYPPPGIWYTHSNSECLDLYWLLSCLGNFWPSGGQNTPKGELVELPASDTWGLSFIRIRSLLLKRFLDFFSKCCAVSTWKLVYTLSRLHNILSSCFTRMGSLWPWCF